MWRRHLRCKSIDELLSYKCHADQSLTSYYLFSKLLAGYTIAKVLAGWSQMMPLRHTHQSISKTQCLQMEKEKEMFQLLDHLDPF
jgi:hypothetical protein